MRDVFGDVEYYAGEAGGAEVDFLVVGDLADVAGRRKWLIGGRII